MSGSGGRVRNGLAVLLLPLAARVGVVRWAAWRGFYQLFAGFRPESFSLMNYGYAGGASVRLDPREEAERYGCQLYDYCASAAPLAGKDVLEVGCGRGGGAAYVAGRFGPRRLVGLDFAPRAVALCRARHTAPGLDFVEGDALDLPFPDRSFDAVLNIESAFCYRSRFRFYKEVRRVLRPGGHFLYADIERRQALARLESLLARAGFEIRSGVSLNREVLAACDVDAARRRALVEAVCRTRQARHIAGNFAALPGSAVYRRLASGERQYRFYVLTPWLRS